MRIGIIGGTALAAWGRDSRPAADSTQTPYGTASALPTRSPDLPDAVFLHRHGTPGQGLPHKFLPHEINYRANLWLLRELGVEAVVAAFAVGGIAPELADGELVLPDQLIDYTWGREHTFSDGANPLFADFSVPFDAGLGESLAEAAGRVGVEVRNGGVYGVTQGPRLETAAEIDRMARDGCTLVGMTAMPEAALARELRLPYAGICMVVNPAAGRGPAVIEVTDMLAVVERATPNLLRMLGEFL